MGAKCENRPLGWKCGRGAGGVPPGATKACRAKNAAASHGIVDAAGDGAFADEETVRDAGELLKRIIVFVRDRLAGTIRASHDEGIRGSGGKEQMVPRRVGQDHG